MNLVEELQNAITAFLAHEVEAQDLFSSLVSIGREMGTDSDSPFAQAWAEAFGLVSDLGEGDVTEDVVRHELEKLVGFGTWHRNAWHDALLPNGVLKSGATQIIHRMAVEASVGGPAPSVRTPPEMGFVSV